MKAYISKVTSVAKGLNSADDFKSWSMNAILPTGEINIDASLIPPMLRRRCSKTSKIALSMCLPLLETVDIQAGVFCSQHGELSNTVNIFQDLTNNEITSPNKFSQCVHNTASGLLSVHKKTQIPFNSIAAGVDTFQMGMIEAFTQNAEFDNILFSIFDDVIPSVYDSLDIAFNIEYGVSFIISKNKILDDSKLINISLYDNSGTFDYNHLPPTLAFIAWFFSSDAVLSLPTLQITKLEGQDD
jgi:hypothetical protein